MCGLFGIVNTSPKPLDIRAFCSLGVANDSRGGDSCGISLDGNVEYGFGKDSALFMNFLFDSKLLYNRKRVRVALGHCRKASIGGISLEKAQPVQIFGKDENLEMIVIHNGTIYNYEDLAKKYLPNEDITGLSDSQVMARIFHKGHYNVLREYRGGGAFVIHDLRKDTVYLFKGCSKSSEHSKEATEERPLFCCLDKDTFIFSSLGVPLVGLYPKHKVYNIPCNKLYKIHKGKLVKLEEIDRTECLQSKPAVVHTPASYYYGEYFNDRYLNFDKSTARYKLGNSYINGKRFISAYGYCFETESQYAKPYWFWDGYLLPGENSYKAIVACSNTIKNPKKLTRLARALTYYPYLEGKTWMCADASGIPYVVDDMKVAFPLTKYVFIISKGHLTSTMWCSDTNEEVFEDLSNDAIQNIVGNVCYK